MIIPLIKIKKTKNKGKGVFASCFIPKGTITGVVCKKCKSYKSIKELTKLSKDRCKRILGHGFEGKEGKFIMPCDETIYLNHSCNANTLTIPETELDVAVRDIKKGEEITYDYRMFYSGKFSKKYYYTNMHCKCGEKNCEGIINPKHPPAKTLKSFWNKQTKSSIKLIKKVPQPLKKTILKEYSQYKNFL